MLYRSNCVLQLLEVYMAVLSSERAKEIRVTLQTAPYFIQVSMLSSSSLPSGCDESSDDTIQYSSTHPPSPQFPTTIISNYSNTRRYTKRQHLWLKNTSVDWNWNPRASTTTTTGNGRSEPCQRVHGIFQAETRARVANRVQVIISTSVPRI
jgi:hypothetical protein